MLTQAPGGTWASPSSATGDRRCWPSTSHGDQWELQRQGLLDAIADFIDAGRVKVFCVGSNNHDSFLNKGAHPFHRSWRQRMFDEYIRDEVVPFVHTTASRRNSDLDVGRLAGRLPRGEHAAALSAPGEALLRFLRCLRPAPVHGRHADDNFYFHNPVDYMASMSDGWFLHQLDSCEIRLVTGSGPWEDSRHTYSRASWRAKASGTMSTTGARRGP